MRRRLGDGGEPSGVAIAFERLGARLTAEGAPHASVAAAVLVCRGRRLLDQEAFANLLGVPPAHVRTLESGWRPPSHAPRRLIDLDTDVDWSAAGVTDRGDPADPASRHPSAYAVTPCS